MKVTLEQHGGLAAGLRRQPRVAESNTLARDAAGELARLVEAAKAAPVAAGGGPSRAPDAMSYTITVEDEGGPVALRQSDTTMSDAFAALLQWLQENAEAR